MTVTATVKVLSAEEIAARAGGDTPFLHPPARATLFAEREMRLRQLARGHAMADYLLFVAELAHEQQARLKDFPSVPLPDADALDRAAKLGVAPLAAEDWPRDAAWRAVLRRIAGDLCARAPAAAAATLECIVNADDAWLDQQADGLLTGVMTDLDLAAAPIVAAGLQVYWTHMLCATLEHAGSGAQPFGRIDDATVCPCCGSRPTASLTRDSGGALGQRYLHCSVCSLQWHLPRTRCAHCLRDEHLAFQSLDTASAAAGEQAAEESSRRAAQAAVQAQTCDDCGHYLKIMHTDRDPFVDPVADDLASLTLDLLVSETGLQRRGVNLMLLFGAGDGDGAAGDRAAPPPPTDPGGA